MHAFFPPQSFLFVSFCFKASFLYLGTPQPAREPARLATPYLAQAGRSCVRTALGLHRPIRILLRSATDGDQLARKAPGAGFPSLRSSALQWPAQLRCLRCPRCSAKRPAEAGWLL